MARTHRKPESNRRNPYSKESKPARKQTNRQARYETKRALLTESDIYPLYKGTCGWLTH